MSARPALSPKEGTRRPTGAPLLSGNPSPAQDSINPPSVRGPSVSADLSSTEENIKVLCRVRPFSNREIDLHNKSNEGKPQWEQCPIRSVVEFRDNTCSFLDHEHDYTEKEKFSFDACLWSIPDEMQGSENPFASQEDLYKLYGSQVLNQTWKGFNTCFFAYGQTGSGKTHSMMGTIKDNEYGKADPGLIPRLCRALYEQIEENIAEQKENYVRTFKVSVQYLEVYNEQVKDLLFTLSELPPEVRAKISHENLKIRTNPATGVFVEHLTAIPTNSWERMIELIDIGNNSRQTAATKMNERSSRSHAIFKITLTQITTSIPKKQFDKPTEHIRESLINLVDLAGCERNKKTGAVGDRLKEAANINKSLLCLKNVIDVLVDNSTSKGPKKRIPYRDSHLTSILADSIGGNSKTFMLVTLSPHSDNAEETLQTLKYGSRARQIVSVVHVNENAAGRMMLDLEDELKRMKEQLEKADSQTVPGAEIEDLMSQINQHEENMRKIESEIKEQQSKLSELKYAQKKEALQRQTAVLANIDKLTKAQQKKSEVVDEELSLRRRLNNLCGDRNDLEVKKAEAELEADELESEIAELTQKKHQLEQDIESCQKRHTKLETFKWDLQKKEENCNARLRKIGFDRIKMVMKFKLECTRMKRNTRRRINERCSEHTEQMEILMQKMRKQNEDIGFENMQQLAEIEAKKEELRSDLLNLKAELDRVEGERHRQIETLEARVVNLRSENKRRKEAMAARISAMTNSWEKRYTNMVSTMDKQYRELVDECNKKYQVEEEREEKALETIRQKHAAEIRSREKEWKVKIETAIAKGKKDYSDSEAKWEKQLQDRRDTMENLRVKLRDVEKQERQFNAFHRRTAAALETTKRSIKGSYPKYKQLYDLLELFHGLYKEICPSRAKLEHLLNHNVNHRRCADLPAIGLGVTDDEEERLKAEKAEDAESETKVNDVSVLESNPLARPIRGRGQSFLRKESQFPSFSKSGGSQGTSYRRVSQCSIKPITGDYSLINHSERNLSSSEGKSKRATTPVRSSIYFSAKIRQKSPAARSAPKI
eukprot:Tbor_TRINITY_DN6128_c1_g5::TRINITY_DN6128_c1_g5_i2::g.22714::m.22714/K17914/KIF13; kinesin family member 13